jgi:hypothetical protein
LVLVLVASLALIPTRLAQADKSQLIKSSQGSGTLYEKLVIASDGAYYVKRLDGDKIITPAFSIYFRLKTGTPDDEKDGHYRIGDPDGNEIGWIKKNFVKKWNTRFCLDPRLPQKDRHFTVFSDGKGKEAAFKFIGQDGQVPRGKKRFAMIVGMPQDKSDDPLHEVVIFTGLVESGGARQQELNAIVNLKLEIVFVVATTASMPPLIQVAQEVVKETARTLSQLPKIQGAVRFGLVEVRDVPPNCDFAYRIDCPLTDNVDEFHGKLSALSTDTHGEDDWPDDVVAGLHAAMTEIKWSPNSCKNIILLGDSPAKDGTPDVVVGKVLQGSTNFSLQQIISMARPLGGSTGTQALTAKYFHTICNNHPDPLDDPREFGKLDDKLKKALRDPEFVRAIGESTPDDIAEAMHIPRDKAKEFGLLILGANQRRENMAKWQAKALSQYQSLAANQGQIQGYHTATQTYSKPDDKNRVIAELSGCLEKAYKGLAAARELAEPETSADLQDGNINRAIYAIVSTNANVGQLRDQPVKTGYARTRDENGRAVADQKIMVFKEELMRLYSVLDSLHTTFKNKSDKAARQNVADILENLKGAVASQAAGQQELGTGTKLKMVIAFDLPLKTPALEISAQDIAVMTTPAFNNWLESLAGARDRAKDLVLKGGSTDWTTLSNELNQEFTFLSLSELP